MEADMNIPPDIMTVIIVTCVKQRLQPVFASSNSQAVYGMNHETLTQHVADFCEKKVSSIYDNIVMYLSTVCLSIFLYNHSLLLFVNNLY